MEAFSHILLAYIFKDVVERVKWLSGLLVQLLLIIKWQLLMMEVPLFFSFSSQSREFHHFHALLYKAAHWVERYKRGLGAAVWMSIQGAPETAGALCRSDVILQPFTCVWDPIQHAYFLLLSKTYHTGYTVMMLFHLIGYKTRFLVKNDLILV